MNKRKHPEQIAGSYSGMPHKVLDSVAFTGASYRAKALLFDLIRQLNGSNNGHLQLTTSWLKKERGWMSADLAQKAKQELIDRRLIVKTRFGGLNVGPDLWAVTWLIVSNCVGLDLRRDQLTPGSWHFFVEPEKQRKRSVKRNGTDPTTGIVRPPTVPLAGTKTAFSPAPAIPVVGNNVNTNVPDIKGRKRIVGKPGKSGRKPTAQESVSSATDDINTLPSAVTSAAVEQQAEAENEGDYTRERENEIPSNCWHDGALRKIPAKASSKRRVVESVSAALKPHKSSKRATTWL